MSLQTETKSIKSNHNQSLTKMSVKEKLVFVHFLIIVIVSTQLEVFMYNHWFHSWQLCALHYENNSFDKSVYHLSVLRENKTEKTQSSGSL
jgi:hypothetical protein